MTHQGEATAAGQSRIRFGYLLERAGRLRPANLIEFARQARAVTRKPVPLIVADMLWCSVRYEMGFRDYAVWDIATLKGRERATWMTHPKSHRLSVALNSPAQRGWFKDKLRFYQRFGDLLGRDWLDVATADAAALADFRRRHGPVVVKPVAGVGGAGVELLPADPAEDPEALRARLVTSGQTLMDAVLVQHEAMSSLYPGSVNTVRVITFLDPHDRLHVLASVLRIGNGAAVDNFASGGMYTLLDAQGVAQFPAVDKHGGVYPRHPVTGAAIAGFAVPHYDRLLSMLEDAARRVPDVPYVGWDVAVTAEGAALIEGNHNSSVFQTRPTVSGVKTGLLAVYRDAIGFR